MSKDIGFLLLRMNFLYSFVPLAKYLKSLGHTIHFIIPQNLDSKPNSLLWVDNKNIAKKIIDNNGFIFKNDVQSLKELELGILFSVEGHGIQEQLPYNVIYIQNFCDFTTRCINKDSKHIYKLKHTLWLQNDYFHYIAKEIGHQQDTLICTLPGYWEYENETIASVRSRYGINETEKLATCFLPRQESVYQKETHLRKIEWNTSRFPGQDLVHAIEFAKLLVDKRYKIILKQRQKNRNDDLKHMSNYIEDLSWYPFTSMDLSFMSDLCYGYMSMSIMDVAMLCGSYINIEKNDYPDEVFALISQWYNGDTIVGHSVYKQIHLLDIPEKRNDLTKLKENIVNAKKKIERFINENC